MEIVFLGAANPETLRMIGAIEQVDPEFRVAGFLDNDPAKKGTMFLGYPVFGGFEVLDELLPRDVRFVNLITGSTRTRYETSVEMAARGCQFANFIHPSVDLKMVHLGVGNYVQENVVLQAAVRLGDNSSIHIGTLVGHETVIGNSVFIAHGCSISGLVQVGDGVFMGTHATVIPRITIGRWATIGAGTVVTKDVPDYATVVGVPGSVIKVADPVYEDGDIFRVVPEN
jgi:sugar O-acyltransferase (sialic acid O-acetyltransferase NeuD family)